MMRLRVIGSVVLAAAAATATWQASASAAAGPPPGFVPGVMQQPRHEAAGHTAVLCKPREWELLPSGMVLYNDVFGPHYSECISVRPSGFKILRARTGWSWGAYPDVFIGCEYTVCSRTVLPQRPIRDYTELSMTLYTRYVATAGDDGTDWWFDRSRPGRSPGHPNGAEIMVWLAWRGVATRAGYYTHIDGQSWYIEHWLAYADHTHWQYVQLRWISPHRHPSARLNMLRIIRYVERHGWVRPNWYPSSLDAGFELVHGGAGSRILKYSVIIKTKR
jgi:hypothetical protein